MTITVDELRDELTRNPIISTDDREIERVGDRSSDPCGHRRCTPGNCRAYTPETLTPTDADMIRAAELIAEGWRSTSSKYRHVIRWRVPPPPASEMIRPEVLDTLAGQKLASYYEDHIRYNFGALVFSQCPDVMGRDTVEHATLSPSLFRAFKKLGGRCC